MDSFMLRDGARTARVRQAEEFLDPRTFLQPLVVAARP